MERKAVLGIMLTLLLTSILPWIFNIQPVKASGTISIRADGSIDPPTAPIQRDGYIYTLMDDIYAESIVIEKDDIVFDGNGYTLNGTTVGQRGFDISYRNNVTVENVKITRFNNGLCVYHSNSCEILDNVVIDCWYAIDVMYSSNRNTVFGNLVDDSYGGISIDYFSDENTVSNNTVTNSKDLGWGLYVWTSIGNTFSNNNVINCTKGMYVAHSAANNVLSNNSIVGSYDGVYLYSSFYNDISGNNVTNSDYIGIWVDSSGHNRVSGNNVSSNNYVGIRLDYSNCNDNEVSGNIVSNNDYGIFLASSANNNTICGNNIANNNRGIYLSGTSNNMFFHNNFSGNTQQVVSYDSTNLWDDDYPSGGNYWNNYTGEDVYSGPHQNRAGGDGIGDVPYVIEENNVDRYPVINPWIPSTMFNANRSNQTYLVAIFSNTTIQNFNFNDTLKKISFKATGISGTVGYCRLMFPKELMQGTFAVLVNGTAVPYTKTENTTHIFLYFTYRLSAAEIDILSTILGDVNGDRKVDGKDIAITAKAFGSLPQHQRWNHIADVNLDNKIDGKDIALVARNYGRVWGTTATIYFDKNLYFPDVKVFWEPEVFVPIGVSVVDDNVALNSVIVKVSSSVDSKNVTLAKVKSGVFFGTVFAVGLRLDESISNANSFNVRYGDVITAEYLDTFWSSIVKTNALFAFPKFVEDKVFVDPNAWTLFDREGIPIVDYGSPIGIQYNPVTICQYAFAQYQAYLDSENVTFRQKFLLQANWLVRNAEQKGNFSVWEYKFDWPPYSLTNPFVSAMAQGHGLSVLTRAYTLTGNTTYLDVAETAMHAFEVEMNSGGVRYTDSDGVWYEEVADVGAPSSKILNGFNFALFGLYEYSFETNNTKGYALFWEGTHTLSVNLYRYDSGSRSYYDLLYLQPAPWSYHKLHIDQLRILYELTSIEIFLFYSNKFQSYIP